MICLALLAYNHQVFESLARFVVSITIQSGKNCAVNNQRPKNLNLFTIRFPIPAIISILHRISGVVLFLLIPLALWMLSHSLSSPIDFQGLHQCLTSPVSKLIIWIFLMPFIYHFVAGIRHLLMDVNIGVELKGGRLSAIITLLTSIVLILLAGVYLW